ncbi:aquaporin [Curtobacterium sp. Leaf261]|uniref:aquaporin n=1 Tax=Curtobacterium sp. Leaf261 TaxID=1736311 RepID=UPI0006F89A51|nr:aquaporin [Curtobacterium sp. Leaf261]KQO61462.1 hypothetical protein ASF23_13445 [Curtobacterium sp. Leaf261]
MSRTIPTPSTPDRTLNTSSLTARLGAEATGTFLLVFALIGAATFTAVFPSGDDTGLLGTGFLGVALTLGLTVMIAATAFGPVSGGHFNPAVSLGLAIAGRLPWRDVAPYVVAQVVGATLGAGAVVLLAAQGPDGFAAAALDGGLASNGFGTRSPGGFGFAGAAIVETIVTALFVTVILRVTAGTATTTFAPIVIGGTLTIMLLVAIPIDNASLNPARSFATAVFAGSDWLGQLWVFVVFPALGATIAGVIGRVTDRRSAA